MITFLVLIATGAYALATVLISRASLSMNAFFAGSLVNAVAAVIPFSVYLASSTANNSRANAKGIGLSIAAGIGIAVFTLALTKAFSLGGNLSYVTPIIYGGTVALSSVIGVLVFKDKIAPLQVVGILMILAGVVCVIVSKARGQTI